MDVDKLLKRMNFSEQMNRLDIHLLNELCLAFSSTIPYETLDLFGGRKRILDLTNIYEAVVDKNRGGMCLELNALMFWLLKKIGFDVEMCYSYNMCDGYDEDDLFADPCSHMVLLVNMDDGEIRLVDVGWGGTSFVFPLRVDDQQKEQAQPNGVYKVTKWDDFYVIEKKRQTQIRINGEKASSSTKNDKTTRDKYQTSVEWEVLYSFVTEPKKLNDFQDACNYAQESHPFCTQNSIAILQDEHHRICLCGNTFIKKRFIDPMTIQAIEMRECSKEEITEILKNRFSIVLDFELQPKSQITWTSL